MRPLAPRLLVWACAGMAAIGACLWPSEYYVVNDPPNSPPFIVKTAVSPEAREEVDGRVLWDPGTDNKPLDFQLWAIEDPDLNDTLWVTWLVSYDPNSSVLNRWKALHEIKSTGSLVRSSPVFRLTVTDTGVVDDTRGRTDGGKVERPYLVEALVSDRQPLTTSPGGNEYPSDAKVDRWRWVVVKASTGRQ